MADAEKKLPELDTIGPVRVALTTFISVYFYLIPAGQALINLGKGE